MIQKIFLDDLPRGGLNRGNRINWEGSIGYKVRFIYDDIEGWVEIVGYDNTKRGIIVIKYLDNYFKIDIQSFKKCSIGKILGRVTIKFKIEIGRVFKDDKRDIEIIDREYRTRYKNNGDRCNDKYYKYRCNKCRNEDWISEGSLLSQKIGCNACCFPPQKVVLGINTIWDTDRWMCGLGVSEEDAKSNTKCSISKIRVSCPDCGRERQMAIYQIYSTKSISCVCGDGGKYPEKFMYSVLEQLNVHFKTEVKFDWCRYTDYKDSNKIKTGRYDFVLEDTYIGNEQVIIETDGYWHGKDNKMSGIKKEESEYTDFTKDKLALKNGYGVIRIDCRKSTLTFIKQNILNSKLNQIFNLSQIDWNKCEEFALKNRVKEACDLWNSGIDSTKEIGSIMKLAYATICTYLNKGTKLGWCNYEGKHEANKTKRKTVEIFKDGVSLGVFPSYYELSKKSEELFGIFLRTSGISEVCTHKRESYKGFHFE